MAPADTSRSRNRLCNVVGVDPEGSIFTADNEDEVHQYSVEGVGEDFYPETVDLGLIDRWIKVNDADSFTMTKRLAREEGILVGGSCGMAAHAALSRWPKRTPRHWWW